ncbi:MAG TPA: MMPL family transporter, partial [Candidatus Limnocylindrales bacterium]
FIVTRYRHGLKAGMPPEDAAVRALNTAGRAVLFAGGTVSIALLGLLVLQLHFLNGLAFASVLAVVLTMASALTLLPALLGFTGQRLLSRRERRRLAESGPQDGYGSGFWARWAGFVSRRPIILAVSAVIVMLVLASPVLSLRLGLSDAGNNPASSTTRKAYDLLAQGFGPGSNGPLLLVAQVGSQADSAALARLTQTLQSEKGVAAVVPFPSKPGRRWRSSRSSLRPLPRTRAPATSSSICAAR